MLIRRASDLFIALTMNTSTLQEHTRAREIILLSTIAMKKFKYSENQIHRLPKGKYCLLKSSGFYVKKTSDNTGSYYCRLIDPMTNSRRELSVGNIKLFSLDKAFEKSNSLKREAYNGISPISTRERRANIRKQQLKLTTFREGFDAWFTQMKNDERWSCDAKTANDVLRSFSNHVLPTLGNMKLSSTTSENIAHCLKPIWIHKNPTAKKIRSYIETVFDWCIATHRCNLSLNPATKTALSPLLNHLNRQIPEVENFAACAVDEVPRLIHDLYEIKSDAANACIFAILTCARSKAVRMAKWSEINFTKKIWIIPLESDKRKESQRNRTIYLSETAIDFLKNLSRTNKSDYIFSNSFGRYLSDTALLNVFQKLHEKRFIVDGVGWIDSQKLENGFKRVRITLHGTSRGSFASWTEDQKTGGQFNFNRKAVNLNLLHSSRDEFRGAYFRSDMPDERRRVMRRWGEYCFSQIDQKTTD